MISRIRPSSPLRVAICPTRGRSHRAAFRAVSSSRMTACCRVPRPSTGRSPSELPFRTERRDTAGNHQPQSGRGATAPYDRRIHAADRTTRRTVFSDTDRKRWRRTLHVVARRGGASVRPDARSVYGCDLGDFGQRRRQWSGDPPGVGRRGAEPTARSGHDVHRRCGANPVPDDLVCFGIRRSGARRSHRARRRAGTVHVRRDVRHAARRRDP